AFKLEMRNIPARMVGKLTVTSTCTPLAVLMLTAVPDGQPEPLYGGRLPRDAPFVSTRYTQVTVGVGPKALLVANVAALFRMVVSDDSSRRARVPASAPASAAVCAVRRCT